MAKVEEFTRDDLIDAMIKDLEWGKCGCGKDFARIYKD